MPLLEDSAMVAVSLDVGSWSDPADLQVRLLTVGLAHEATAPSQTAGLLAEHAGPLAVACAS
jgi:hypothetical protein